jgi:uncharacterized protein YecE (DUF72 family)
MEFHIGCSGWSYGHWRDSFYRGVPQKRWLEHYAEQFSTVEINATHYRLPAEKTVRAWRDRAPDGFIFAVKASRTITHFKRLRDSERSLELLFSRARLLGEKLGPVLYQLPDDFAPDIGRLRDFLALLPQDLTHAFEFRHHGWWTREVFGLLREHHAAFCLYDRAEEETPFVATSPDVYVRFHGPHRGYAGGYSPRELERWAEGLRALRGVERCWVYFNNDVGGHAPVDAARFRDIVRG